MKRRIQNRIEIKSNTADIDFTKCTDIEVFLAQGNYFERVYVPEVLASDKVVVTIPFVDAMELRIGKAFLQIALTDEFGNARASDAYTVDVTELYKEAGYDIRS